MSRTTLDQWIDFVESTHEAGAGSASRRASFYRDQSDFRELSDEEIAEAEARHDVRPVEALELRITRQASRQAVLDRLRDPGIEGNEPALIYHVLNHFPGPVPEAIPIIAGRLGEVVEGESREAVAERSWILDTLLAQHPRLELEAPQHLESFLPATEPLLHLLRSGDHLQSSHHAADLLALIRPPGLVDILADGLRTSLERAEGSYLGSAVEFWAVTLGREDAAGAVPLLERALSAAMERPAAGVLAKAAYALSEIGAPAADALGTLRQAATLKSLASTPRQRLSACVDHIERLTDPDPSNEPRWRAQVEDPRLRRWLDDLADERPWPNFGSSAPQAKAKKRIARHADAIDIEQLARLLDTKPPAVVFEATCHLLGVAISKGGSEEGRSLLRRWLEKPKLTRTQEYWLLRCAKLAREPAAMPIALRRIERARGRDSMAEIYLETFGGDDAARALLPKLDERKNREGVLVTLGHIGSELAVPELLHYASRPIKSKKNDERWWRTFSIEALGRIASPKALPGLLELFDRFDKAHRSAHRRRLLASLYACDAQGEHWRQLLRHWLDGIEEPKYRPVNSYVLDFFDYATRLGLAEEPEIVAAWEKAAPHIADAQSLDPWQLRRLQRHCPHLDYSAFAA